MFLYELFKDAPPLSKRKDPQLAALLGFILGGVGIGLYFLSFIDALIPLGLVIALSFVLNFAGVDYWTGLLLGAIIASVYGYFRASVSNDKLAAAEGLQTGQPPSA